MPAPLSPILLRYVAIRGGAAIGRYALKRHGKRTAAERMATKAARKGAVPLSPALQGPYVAPIRKSSGGEDAQRAPGRRTRTMRVTRKSMRGRSAQMSSRRNVMSAGAKMIPRRGKRCPPGYRYDRKRKMCIQNNYK